MRLNQPMQYTFLALALGTVLCCFDVFGAEPQRDWIELFDGRTLDGWKASENADTWRVEDGRLLARLVPTPRDERETMRPANGDGQSLGTRGNAAPIGPPSGRSLRAGLSGARR